MPNVFLPTRLSPLDLALVALYLVAITIFGLQFRNKNKDKSLKNYFLANNTIPWWAIALSIVSAETSTLTIISIPGVAFTGNFGFLQVVLGYMLGRIVVAALFLPRYFRGEMLTAYQLIQQRFGSKLHKLTAGLFLLTRAAAEGVRVFAISIVVGIAIGTGDTLSIAIISALTLLYTFEGGMAAVIWTDVVQMALYVAGTLVAVWSIGQHVPGGWFAPDTGILAAAAHAGKFHLFDFSLTLTRSYTFWAGVLGGTFLTMASHGTDQLMVQRLLAARNLRESRLALLSSGVVIFFQFSMFLLIGAGLYIFYNLPKTPRFTLAPDRLFPTFIVQQMPHGIAGLLVAAILAAAMSNLSAALNSLASTTVIDFYVPFRNRQRKQAVILSAAKDPRISPMERTSTDKQSLGGPSFESHPMDAVSSEARPPSLTPAQDTTNISRLATLFWAIVLFAIAVYSIQVGGKGHVVEIALSIASVAYGCLLGVFLLGTLTKYATQTGTMIGMATGFLTNLFLYQATLPTPLIPLSLHIAFTWYVLIGSAMTFAVGTLFSLILPRPKSENRLRQITALLVLLTLTLSTSAQEPGAPFIAQPHRAMSGIAPAESTASTYPEASASGLYVGTEEKGLQPLGSALPAPAPIYDFTPIDTLLTEAIAAKKLPGAVVVIGHNGKVVYQKAYGLRKLAGEPNPQGQPSPAEPMTEDTLFDMASLTKVMVTTTAILQLWEQGKLDLDAPVSKYLPEFTTLTGAPNPAPTPMAPQTPQGAPSQPASPVEVGSIPPKTLPNPQSGAPSFEPYAKGGVSSEARPPSPNPPQSPGAPSIAPSAMGGIPQNLAQATTRKSQITIRQLLTHYSGLPEDISLRDPWGLAAPDKAEGIRRAMAAIPYGPANLTFKYSDINFITLGALVEKLTMPGWSIYSDRPTLDIYAAQNIFNPLKMKETRFLAFDKVCGPVKDIPIPWRAQLLRLPVGDIADSAMDCDQMSWTAGNWIARAAPTAHDDQLTPAVNPDYDHLLRGVVHDPTTRRMGGVAGHAGLFSNAHDAALFCQALLDKMTHGTGPFPLKQSTLQSAIRPQAPLTAVHDATIFTPDGQPTKGTAQRALGWDLNTAFSRPRGEIFPIATGPDAQNHGHPGSFGHTGFTGTSLWLDPTSNTYVILLANAIHPRGGAPISALRGQVATAAARALGLTPHLSAEYKPDPASCVAVEVEGYCLGVAEPLSIELRAAYITTLLQPGKTPGAPFMAQPHRDMSGTTNPNPTTNPGAPGLASETWVSPVAYHLPSKVSASRYPEASASGLSSSTQTKGLQPLEYAPQASGPKISRVAYTPSCPTQFDTVSHCLILPSPALHCLTGIAVLEQTHYAALLTLAQTHQNHLRIALLTNQSGVDQTGHRTIDLLLHANPKIELKKIFTPEHGLLGKQDTEHLKTEEDPTTHLPVISLYGAKPADRHPKQSDLRDIDAVVIDLQDAGVRFWTYTSVLGYFLEAAAKAHIEIVVLDRPNPVGGIAFGGPISDPGTESYVNFMPTPVRHGMTFGELARFYNANAKLVDLDPALLDARAVAIGTPTTDDAPPATQAGLHAQLTVIKMQNWNRDEYYADTGVPWLPPSPNLRTPRAAILYPAIGLIETTNISVGRGTQTPFEHIGAPWIKATELVAYLTKRQIPGITITPTTLTIAETPEHYPSHGQTIPGIHFEVTDPTHFDSPEFGIELLAALHHLYPKEFQLEKVKTLLVNAATLAALKANQDPRDIAQTWQPALKQFATQRTQALLY